MTVEVRTNPPIVYLYVRGTQNDAALTIDPFGEMASGAAKNAKSAAKSPTFDPNGPMDPVRYAKYMSDLEKYNVKTLGAISVFINGLDELWLALEINSFQNKVAQNADISAFLKGTRFSGKDKGKLCSVAANLLKSALPDDMSVKIGVKFHWEVADVVRYAVSIREALAKSGIAQPSNGYSGAKSGLLRGFGVYKVS